MKLQITLGKGERRPRRRTRRFLNALVLPGGLRLGRRRVAGLRAPKARGSGARGGSSGGAAVLPAWQPLGVRLVAVLRSARVMSLVLLLICLGAFAYTVNDASFYVTRAEVSGRQTIPLKDVYTMTGVLGLHLFWVNPAQMAATLAASPSIAAAQVEVGWPARVAIRLVERAPVAVWQQAGAMNWVGADGRLMPARNSTAALGLVTIVVEGKRPLPEDAHAVKASIVQAALALRTLRPNIERLTYYERGGLEYNDGRGWQAFFGTGDDMAQKLVVYETLVEYLLKERGLTPQQIEYIVVTDVKHPFYKVREE